jgi:hypothetical protein
MVYWLAYYRRYKTKQGDKLYWRRFTSEIEMEEFIANKCVIPWTCIVKEKPLKMSIVS